MDRDHSLILLNLAEAFPGAGQQGDPENFEAIIMGCFKQAGEFLATDEIRGQKIGADKE
jgi:hypothetical protein